MSGTIVGIVDREKIIDGKSVQSGDVLIGFGSNGLHTNGYSLARKVIPVEELQAKLEAIFESRGSAEVFLRADEEAAYGVVVQAMAAARRAGATRLGIVTEEER